MPISYFDVDRRVWGEELDGFIPQRVFDVHAHIFLMEHCLQAPDDPSFPRPTYLDRDMPHSDLESLRAWQNTLMPGREVHSLLIPYPFYRTDAEAVNLFTAQEAAKPPGWPAEMLVTPAMTPEYVARTIEQGGFVGLKPYLFFAPDPWNARVTDMIPEGILEVADDKGFLVTLHLSKPRALADPENIADLQRISARYPRIRWILAHCGRCFAPWAAEGAIERIRDCPNFWYDTSGVCAPEVFNLVMDVIPPERILFGSDSLGDGNTRGKYAWYGYSWNGVDNATRQASPQGPETTFVIYESLRALRYAVKRHGWDDAQVQGLFFDNAHRLVCGWDSAPAFPARATGD